MPSSADFPALTLADGGRLPVVGLGTWKLPVALAPDVVRSAVAFGYRHLDCACDYGNEPAVGAGVAAALRDGLCARDDLWLTSKLWNTYHRPEHVRPACERTLADLGVDALDLYLVHFPIALEFVPFDVRYPPGWIHDPDADPPAMRPVAVPFAETWGAMEELVDAGLVRHIGVSNLAVALLRDLLGYARIRPAVHQVEMHPYLAQARLFRFCRDEGIAVTAFSPFGGASYVPLRMAEASDSLLVDPVVATIAAAHGISPARALLRWAVQRGTAVIPKAQDPAHLRENLDLFGFALDPAEMSALDALDRHRRFNDPGVFCEVAFHTFYPIFE